MHTFRCFISSMLKWRQILNSYYIFKKRHFPFEIMQRHFMNNQPYEFHQSISHVCRPSRCSSLKVTTNYTKFIISVFKFILKSRIYGKWKIVVFIQSLVHSVMQIGTYQVVQSSFLWQNFFNLSGFFGGRQFVQFSWELMAMRWKDRPNFPLSKPQYWF